MEQTAIVLIVITLFLLAIIVGLLTLIVYRLMKPNGEKLHPEIRERIKDLDQVKFTRSDLTCPNHPNEAGEVTCAICDKLFCKSCIKPFKNLYFCKEHLSLVTSHEWEEVLTLKTSTEDPEQGVRLYDLKKNLFEQEQLPTYVETHYKINVDHDFIETYLVLFSMKTQASQIKNKLKSF